MKEWEKQFDTLSLSKGKRLWSEGKVEDLKKSDNKITASFSGIKRYNVTISLRNGIPARMKCQCPKAKGGSKCEHMAAALYEAFGTEEERREEQGKQEQGDSKYNTIREKVLQAAREHAQKESETQERMKRERAAQEQAAAEEAKRIEEEEAEQKAAEEAKRKVREEAERRIAERAAEKAAKKAERKRKRQEAQLAAEAAARKAAEEKALKEKQQQEELVRKAAEAEERRNAEEAARKMAAEEREKKRVKKVQAAIARTKGEELKQEEREEGYCYFDLDSIRSSLQFTKNNLTNGRKLSQSGKIQLERFSTGYMSDEDEPVAEVVGTGEEGRRKFNIRMIISRTGVRSRDCGCMECMRSYRWFQSNYGCDYTAGLINQIENYLEKYQVGDATDKTGSLIMNRFNGIRARQVVADVRQDEASLSLIPRMIKQEDKLSLSFKIGSGKMFVVKSLSDLCEHVDNSETAVYGSATEINHQIDNFTPRGKEWYAYIRKAVQEEQHIKERLMESGWYSGKRSSGQGNMELYGWRLDQFFRMLGNEVVEYEDRGGVKKGKLQLHCKEMNPKLSMKIKKSSLGGRQEFHGIDVVCQMPVFFSGTEAMYFIQGEYLCRVDSAYMANLQPLISYADNGQVHFQIGRNKLSEFYYQFLPEIQDTVEVREENSDIIHQYLPPEVQFVFLLDSERNNITCRIQANYGEHTHSVMDVLDDNCQMGRYRIPAKEEEILYRARQVFPYIDKENDVLHCGNDEELMYRVLDRGLEELMELGDVQYTKGFRNMFAVKKMKLSVGVSVSGGLLNLEIGTDDLSREELLDVLNSYRKKKTYYRMKNGDFLKLEEGKLGMLDELMQAMRLSTKELAKKTLQLPAYRTLYLDKLLEENEEVYNTRDSHFRKMIKNFKTVKDADYEVPQSLDGIMREYQKDGYRWLRTLSGYRFGGILADDMGLGKTLQMIAVLLAAKEEGDAGTSLIVAPASLVFNWGEEFTRFAPQLKILTVTGSQDERQKKLENYQEYDVLVTSYDLLKRDIAMYEDKQFLYQVIDEAQYIKNHTTAAARAVKVIKSQMKFAMTGTPIENRLSELWSIFDYLMPGFLYSYEAFRKEIEQPIVKHGEEDAMDRLKKLVSPFILRRIKEDVLKDLPDKLEEIRYVKMGADQQKLYDAQVVHMQTVLAKQGDEEFNKNKIQILAELTRLRQICCDPSLCFENYKKESTKRESCLELIQSAIDGGHKMLVFSQFTTMLDILAQELDALKTDYYMITGATAKEKRLQMVNAFNTDSTPVFLISLKAGGVGLNLTGADVVIHYDPWWNIAAQNQATDRAHRIGQTKKVVVYKMIVKSSIEEKIQKLQETKKDLADQIVNTETGQFGGMSREELLELLEV